MKNKIYFSASIQGVKHKDPNFGWELVKHMKELGYNVLSEHVAARNRAERRELFIRNAGLVKPDDDLTPNEIYHYEIKWVDEADFVIAMVDGPSLGVGMEIMRAITKSDRGLNYTNILCLVHVDNFNKLTNLLKGIPKDIYPNFNISTYQDLNIAKHIVKTFLTQNSP